MDKTKLVNLITANDWAAAKEYIVSELENVGNDLEIIKYLGLCNINLGCFQDAIYNYETVVKEDTEDALSIYYLATLRDRRESWSTNKLTNDYHIYRTIQYLKRI